jgi:hypothetical protein
MLHTGSPHTLYHYQPSCYILFLLRLYITTNHHATYWFSSYSIPLPTIMLHTGSPHTLFHHQPSCYILVLLRLYHYQPSCYILFLLRLYITTNHHATYWFSSYSISLPTIMLHTGSPQTLYHYQPSCYILVLLRLYINTNHHATYWFSSDSISIPDLKYCFISC